MPVPLAPTSLLAASPNNHEVDLVFVAGDATETGFIVQRSTDGGATYTQVGTTGTGFFTFTDLTVSASISYVYRVLAYNGSGNSTPSPTASVTVSSLYIDIATVRTEVGMLDSTLVPDSFITLRIKDAQDTIDDQIGDRYVLPLINQAGALTVPDLIVHLALEQTVGMILMTQFSEESKDTDKGWKRRFDYVSGILDEIQEGKRKLRDPVTRLELQRSTLQQPSFFPTAASNAPEATDSTRSKIRFTERW